MKLEKFIKDTKPISKKSKFDDFEKEILELYRLNYSQNQIVDFLKQNGLKCLQSELCRYLKKQKGGNKNVRKITTPTPSRVEAKREVDNSTKSAKKQSGGLTQEKLDELLNSDTDLI